MLETASDLRDECRLNLLERHSHQGQLEVTEVVACRHTIELIVSLGRLLIVELISEVDFVEFKVIQLILRGGTAGLVRTFLLLLLLDENGIVDILVVPRLPLLL